VNLEVRYGGHGSGILLMHDDGVKAALGRGTRDVFAGGTRTRVGLFMTQRHEFPSP
jgi:hypothetical protein